MTRPPLPEPQLDDARRLLQLWQQRSKTMGITQANIAEAMNVSRVTVHGYLNGKWPLNPRVAGIFARELRCRVDDFSPSLQREIDEISAFSSSNTAGTIAVLESVTEKGSAWPFPSLDRKRIAALKPSDQLKIEGLLEGLLLSLEKKA